jgi:spore coat protein CotH
MNAFIFTPPAFNMYGAYVFWRFFIIGNLCHKYEFTGYITGKPWVTVAFMLAFIVLIAAFSSRLGKLPHILEFNIAILAIASLICLFHHFEKSETFLDRQLLFIGNSTLDIYIYHYFFIRFINLEFLKTQGLAVELVVTVTITIVIAYACAGIGALIRTFISLCKKMTRHIGLLSHLFFCFIPFPLLAEEYDASNYPPEDISMKIDETNLPIVFIDTRCGDSVTQIIHRDYRIAVRMKIVNNPDGVNYGDTVAHPDQTVDYEGWVAIRYRGNTSLSYSKKKPYNFKTMKTADVSGEKQKTGLLGMPKDNTWVLLGPYSDRSLLRDVMVFQLARPYFDYTPRCRYCEMVLDGVYYGIYVLTENIRKGKNRLNLDDPGLSGDELTGGYQLQIDRKEEPHFTSKYKAIDSLGKTYSAYNEIYFQYKHPDFEDMDSVQIDYIQRRVDQMEDVLASNDFTNPDTGYRQYLDPMSFIDQQLSQEFSGNVDGYRLSTNIYKHRDSQDPRFKTALWDFNLAFGNSNAANATQTDFWRYQNSYLTNYNAYNKVPFWWMRLMDDPAYVKQLKERWTQYRRESYSNEHIEATIDSIVSVLREGGALERNNTVWKMFKSTTYDMEIDRLKQWISKRVAWMDEQLAFDPTSIIIPSDSFNKDIVGYFNLKGMRLSQPSRREFCIVRFKDGSSKLISIY